MHLKFLNMSGRLLIIRDNAQGSHELGGLIDVMDQENTKCACIITSSLARETGNILKSYLRTPCLVDSRLDEYYGNYDSHGFLRILMAIWNAFEVSASKEAVVMVTHPCVLHRCARLFGRSRKFRSMHLYKFPWVAAHGWYCETGEMFRQRREGVCRMVELVDRMWDKAPVPNVAVEVFLDSDDWLVETDAWAMKKWRLESTIIMAITKIKMDGVTLLRCLRDLMPEHVHALKTLDGMYPDSKWVKYIMYPPFVWRLHVHIQGRDAPLPYKNVYLLKDVICSLEMSKGSQDYLVWRY